MDKREVVIFDLASIELIKSKNFSKSPNYKEISSVLLEASAKPIQPILDFYNFVKQHTSKILIVTGRQNTQEMIQATTKNLIYAGYYG